MSFRHSLKCGIPIHKEDILHEQSISQMGKYEQYIKNNIVPLRDPDPDARPTAKPTFGNPYKVGLCPRAILVEPSGVFKVGATQNGYDSIEALLVCILQSHGRVTI